MIWIISKTGQSGERGENVKSLAAVGAAAVGASEIVYSYSIQVNIVNI